MRRVCPALFCFKGTMKAENIPLSLLSAHFHLTDTSNDNIYGCGRGAGGGGAHTQQHHNPQIIGGFTFRDNVGEKDKRETACCLSK